ncbi:MAG TPA: hypothetical protein VIQ31_04440 [Phormidium sp.]
MLKQVSALGLLGAAVLGSLALPAAADTAVVQQTTQDMVIQGSGNTGIQSSEQINVIRRDRVNRDITNTGIVQDVYQGGTVVGNDNAAYQENSQVNVIQDVQRPRHRNNHNRGVSINQK